MVAKEKGDVWRYNRFAAHFCFRRETSGQTPQPKLTSSSNPGKLESTSRPSSATSQVRLPSPSSLTHRAGGLVLPLGLCVVPVMLHEWKGNIIFSPRCPHRRGRAARPWSCSSQAALCRSLPSRRIQMSRSSFLFIQ